MRSLCRVCGTKEKLKYTTEELKSLQRNDRFKTPAGNICLDCEDRIRMYTEDASVAANGQHPGYDEDELIVVDDDEHFYSMLDKEIRIKQQQRIQALAKEPVVVSDDEDDIVFKPVKTTTTTTPRKRKIVYDEEAMIVVDTLTIHSSDDEMESPKKKKSAKLTATEVTLGKSANTKIEKAQITPKKPVASGSRSVTPEEVYQHVRLLGSKSNQEIVVKRAKPTTEEIGGIPITNGNCVLAPISSTEKLLQIATIDSSAPKLGQDAASEDRITIAKVRSTSSVATIALDDDETTAKKSKPNGSPKNKLNGTLKSPTPPKLKSDKSVNLTSHQPVTKVPKTSAKKRTLDTMAADRVPELNNEDAATVESLVKKPKENLQSNQSVVMKKSKGSPKKSKKLETLGKSSSKKAIMPGLPNGILKVTEQPVENKALSVEMRGKNNTGPTKASPKSDTHPKKKNLSPVGRRSIKLNGKSVKPKQQEEKKRLKKEVTPKKKLEPKTSNAAKSKHKAINVAKVAKPIKTKTHQKVAGKVNAASKNYKLKAAALGKVNKADRKISKAKNPTEKKSTTSKATSLKDSPKESLKGQPCPECKQTFMSIQEAAQHIRSAHPTHSSDVLKARYKKDKGDPLTQRLRYRKQITLYECTGCGTVHTSYQIHLKHIAEERLAAKRLKKREKEKSSATLEKPKRKRGPKKRSSQPAAPKTVALTLVCKHCAFSCGGLIQLNKHYFMAHQAEELIELKSATNAKRKIKAHNDCESLDINSNHNANTPGKALEASQA